MRKRLFGALAVAGAAASLATVSTAGAAVDAREPTRAWPGLDTTRNTFYSKLYRLAATGRRVEIWVARDLRFRAGDCRNRVERGRRVRVTAAQATYLARQFDRVIYERQRALFGVPRTRTGVRATDRRFAGGPRGSRTVVLVDNVRDANYYDRNNTRNHAYVAGFHARGLTEAVDRNVVTIDGYDWAHRLRARPPHTPVPGDNCASAPGRPFLYEATLAHEYQHLLQDIADPEDVQHTWVDEGLADFAQTLSGYARPERGVDEFGFDSHVQCILGWLNVQTPFNPQPRGGGPENSLTRWSDQGDDEILCDYGAAYTFMHVFTDRYGPTAAGELHRQTAPGLVGVQLVLEKLGAAETSFDLLHDWAATLALDAALDRGTPLRVGDASRFRSRSLRAAINWDNPDTHSAPGVPVNGSDFVRLRDASGRYLAAAELQSLSFRGTRPTRVGSSYTVQLVGYAADASVPATHVTLQLEGGLTAVVDAEALRALFDPRVDTVAAIVTYNDRTETLSRPLRYTLAVNGVTQPGG